MAYPALGLSTPRGSWGVSCVARASSSSVSRLRTKCRGGVIPIRIPKIPKSCLVTARCLSPSSNPNSPKREDPLNAFPSRRLEGSASKLPCAWCGDTGASECKTCGGDGVLSPGGFHLKNHVDVKCVGGTNWQVFPSHHIPPTDCPYSYQKGILRPEGRIPSDYYPDCLLIPIPYTRHDRLTLFLLHSGPPCFAPKAGATSKQRR
jgi:hypothetical protein